MKLDFGTCNEEELWKYVASHLKKNNVDTILVGGAVVSIYSEGAYESGDLDLVLTNMFDAKVPPYLLFRTRETKGMMAPFRANFL